MEKEDVLHGPSIPKCHFIKFSLFHIPYNQLHITAFKTGSETVNVSTGAMQVLSDSSKPAGPVTIL